MKYQISSGQGPSECELGVAKFLEYLYTNYDIEILEESEGYELSTYRSVKILTDDDLSEYIGTIKWICQSPYRPHHKRKNWFIKFEACDDSSAIEFDESKVVIQTFRASGNGGQHVNTTDSAVRAIYIPTGDSVVYSGERSQYANKQKAIKILEEKIKNRNNNSKAKDQNNDWRQHTQLVRGNSNVVFEGRSFKRKK